MKQAIHAAGAPKAIGPYSPAIKVGDLVFTSGQIGLDPVSGDMVSPNTREQAEQVMKNLQAVLEASGARLRQGHQDDDLSRGHGRIRAGQRGLR